MIFNKSIIDRKKKHACTILTKMISPPFWHFSPLPVTLSSDKHHDGSIFLYLLLSTSIVYLRIVYFKSSQIHSSNVGKSLIEVPLTGTNMGYGKILFGFSIALRKDHKQFY